MTVRTLIEAAYRLVGNSNPSSIELDNALESLNTLLTHLSIENLNLFAVVTESFSLVVGQSIYTIGSGGDFSTIRPTKILEGVYIQDSNSIDYPVIPMSRQQYNQIQYKIDTGRPTRIYYEPEFTLGKIRFNYKPEVIETLYIDSWKPLTEFSTLATTVSLPPEYEKVLKYNLAIELAVLDPPKMIVQLAMGALAAIRSNNSARVEPIGIDDYMAWELYR